MKKLLYILSALFISEKINSVQTGKFLSKNIINKIQELLKKIN